MPFNLGRDVHFTDSSGNKKKLSDEMAKIGTGGTGGGTGGSSTLAGLTDVNVTTLPVEGDMLQYKSGKWKPVGNEVKLGNFKIQYNSTTGSLDFIKLV